MTDFAQVLVIAGTADARAIIGKLAEMNFKVAATVATGFGRELLEEIPGVKVLSGRLDSAGMLSLIKDLGIRCLVDASHPYARVVSENAVDACRDAGIPYLRYEREQTVGPDGNPPTDILMVESYEEAAEKSASFKGNILLTTGSNTIRLFTQSIADYSNRLFARVLPESGVLKKCEEAGLSARNIIAMKGPFTEEMNFEMLKYCQASVLVTKESGETGGTPQKLAAAARLGIPVIMITRPGVEYPAQTGIVKDVLDFVREYCK